MKLLRRACAAAALVAVVGCGGGSDASEPTTSSTTTIATTTTVPPPPVVAVLGDSLLADSADELTSELAGVNLQLYHRIGLTTEDAQYGLAKLLATNPIALGIVLGTNDVLREDPAQARRTIERMVNRFDA